MNVEEFINYKLIDFWQFDIEIKHLLLILSIFILSQLFHFGIKKIISQQKKSDYIDESQSKILIIYSRNVTFFFSFLISLNLVDVQIQKLLEYKLIAFGSTQITFYHIIGIIFISFIARFFIWTFKKIIVQQERAKKIDVGKGFAIYKITKYIIIIITIALVLETVGIKITILLAGSAALLVGLGLGVQQIFNDVISGIFLLFEGTVSVHDIIEIDGLIGEVKHIDIRTSKILTRDHIMIIVPNSKLISDNVINWTLNKEATRFKIEVGVAYGSDTEKVRTILFEILKNHPDVSTRYEPRIRFSNFGESSLDFTLLYWSLRLLDAEDLKSEIRFEINKRFRDENIEIPFPQRDLHFKSNDTIFNIKQSNNS